MVTNLTTCVKRKS